MRSSKSRSRSKPNRPRTLGNIVNRVFDSSGPEGKVRGTPQQIIEKYQMLAGDSQRSNDRVAAENFSQHAEHYTRMLAEAMREMAAEQESRQQSNGQQGQNRQNDYRPEYRQDNRSDQRQDAVYDGDQPDPIAFDVIDPVDSHLVDMPDRTQPRRNDQQRNDQQRNDAPRHEQPRRDNRPRNDQQRNDQPRSDQPRNDRPRPDQSRNDQPRPDQPRNDQPRSENQREDRRRDPAPQLRFVEATEGATLFEAHDTPVQVTPQIEPPVFESPAALVAQVEAKAAPKPRAPRVKKVEPSVE